jgi:hypothetical protein
VLIKTILMPFSPQKQQYFIEQFAVLPARLTVQVVVLAIGLTHA